MVLSKLYKELGIDLIVVSPKDISGHVGDAVYQTKKWISFKLCELKEYSIFGIYSSFRGLARLIFREKPEIVVIGESYLLPFIFNIFIVLAMKSGRSKLILQSIPFRLPKFDEARENIYRNKETIKILPYWTSVLLQKSGLSILIRLFFLHMMKYAYCTVDAHLNYVEGAFEIFGSYGVKREKIFLTFNSPDTDILFKIRESLASEEPVLPKCENRLIHVGRLVEWKRVDLLLRAFARVKKKFLDAELLIIGYGPQEQELKNLCNELHLSDSVKFLGGIYEPEILGKYLLSSTIYVLAGMGGLSINDAMCFGLPIICSVCDGTEKMLVRDEFNGKFFKEGDEFDLVEKIEYLLSNPQLRRQMGNNSVEIIKNEINIHTVINGFNDAFQYVSKTRASHV